MANREFIARQQIAIEQIATTRLDQIDDIRQRD
jgi:hypothetical protein